MSHDISVEVEIVCTACGDELYVEDKAKNGRRYLHITPCKECMAAEHSDGVDEGKKSAEAS